MPQAKPTQVSGAIFLANSQNALLADEPRVGKTGAALMALDMELSRSALVVTPASGRAVWRRNVEQWCSFRRPTQILLKPPRPVDSLDGISIIGWPQIVDPAMRAALMKRKFDRVILDESHRAKDFDAKRTQAAYGELMDGGDAIVSRGAVTAGAGGVWCLTGTPLPHSPADAYPMLRALAPARLQADNDKSWPDVTKFIAFRDRYCVVRMKKISNFRKIPVVVGGRNLAELNQRMAGFMLLRTQQDVGIEAPIYEMMPLMATDAMRAKADGDLDRETILAAAEAGDTKKLELNLCPLRRQTGILKAPAVVEAVKDEFADGLDKIVLMYWHREVGQILRDELAEFGVVGIDGSTPPKMREQAEREFLHGAPRVFLGQIEAAGEAIDLSSSAMLWFVETSLKPKDMKQAALRITNHTQTRQAIVRVCAFQGSIDEALQARLMKLWAIIREVLHGQPD